jgi:hypothetical protein
MIEAATGIPTRLITGYYGATVVFVVLDYFLDFNIRLMFLDAWPGWRALYYAVCLGIFALMLRRPAWSSYIGAAESLLTLSLLIIAMGIRVIVVTDEMLEAGSGFVTVNELLNFVVSGAVAYLSLMRGVFAARGEIR